MLPDDDVATKVRALMVDALDLRLDPQDIGAQTSLYSPMIQLDSLNLLQLLLAVETEFGGHVEDEDVMEADLETVGDLIELVRRHVAGPRREIPA
ncbi:hypothetical protein SLA_7473 [Streptomyces laurentii]|uniref:Carrier domain-containing protein n=1 Tax=Streptomyces laurentii TaxID=39478 RepID=A0A169PRV0_STRLU|nr:hypothetical protein SLA_7473 [Streptomyces laurentii]